MAVDLLAAQSPSYRKRGIARHGLAFTEALLRRRPDLVGSVLLHPELPPVAGLEGVVASGRAVSWQEWQGDETIFHLTSAFEPEVPAGILWPRRAVRRGMKLAVTVYDLIPDIFPDMYLMDPGLRRRWRAGREIVRVADHVFALSDSGAEDVVRMLGVDERRVSVIWAGCDDRFRPGPADAARARVRRVVDGLGGSYVVYNGAIDPRKNMERLVHAFAALPEQLLAAHQLVLVCRATAPERNHFMVMADRLGIGGRVVMPGFVDDDVLVALYRSARLVVFPSLYEGYGLPVVEAMACGAPVIVADNSSLRELAAEEARFDALDVDAISAAMARALTDEALYARLVAASSGPAPGWDAVADRAAAGYERLLATPVASPRWRRRPLLAVVAPPPSAGIPAAAEAAVVVEELRSRADVDLFADGPPGNGRKPVSASGLAGADRAQGGYDGVVVWVGDDPHHHGAAWLLAGDDALPQPVAVVATGASLVRAYGAGAEEDRERLAGLAARLHPGSEPADVSSPERLARSGYVLARAAVAASVRYFVPSPEVAARVRVDAWPGQAGRVEVLHMADPAAAAEAILGAIRDAAAS